MSPAVPMHNFSLVMIYYEKGLHWQSKEGRLPADGTNMFVAVGQQLAQPTVKRMSISIGVDVVTKMSRPTPMPAPAGRNICSSGREPTVIEQEVCVLATFLQNI